MVPLGEGAHNTVRCSQVSFRSHYPTAVSEGEMIAAALLIASVATAAVPRGVQHYFPGRSGDIMIINKQPNTKVFVSDLRDQYVHDGKADLHTLPSMIQCGLGIQLSNHQGEQTCNVDPFQLNRANVLFTVEGMDEKIASKMHVLKGKKLHNVDFPFHGDFVSVINSIATTVPPSSHGIVGSSWIDQDGKLAEAYSNLAEEDVGRHASSIADLIAAKFESLPLFVAVGSSGAVSQTFLPELLSSHFISVIIHEDGISTPISELNLQKNEVIARFEKMSGFQNSFSKLYGGSVSISHDKSEAVVTIRDKVTHFNLHNPAEFLLFSEITVAVLLPELLGSSSEHIQNYVNDDIPDFISISFKSLQGIESIEKFECVAAMIDSAIQLALSSHSEVYGSRMGSQIVGIKASKVSVDYFKSISGENHLRKVESSHLLYPNVYLKDTSLANIKQICSTLKHVLLDAQIDCPDVEDLSRQFFTLADNSTNSTNSTTISSEDIAIYQICLWLTVALILVLYASVYAMAFMENKRDTMLYTRFNPGSGGKKSK